jgi:hypothetical protein
MGLARSYAPRRLSAGWLVLAAGFHLPLAVTVAEAQSQPSPGAWQTGIDIRGASTEDAAATAKPSPTESKAAAATPAAGAVATLTLQAVLTENGQRIDQGLVWRIFEPRPGPDGKSKLVSLHREAVPAVKLAAGEYLVNAAFGRAQQTRRIILKPGTATTEKFVLNAGGLRLTAYVGTKGVQAPANSVVYDILSDERDQFGNRTKIMSAAKPGLIIRLNSGIYHLVSTLGDANATVTADVTVEPGKLTEAAVAHAVSKATFKLVAKPGGEALADTHWSISTPQGELVKESVGALPTHTLAPGTYIATARSGGRVYKREFTLRMDETTQVEVVMQ